MQKVTSLSKSVKYEVVSSPNLTQPPAMMRIHSQMQQSQSSEGETDDDSKLEKHISSSVEEEFREPQKGKRRAASKRKVNKCLAVNA